jgi:hypothetical protein
MNSESVENRNCTGAVCAFSCNSRCCHCLFSHSNDTDPSPFGTQASGYIRGKQRSKQQPEWHEAEEDFVKTEYAAIDSKSDIDEYETTPSETSLASVIMPPHKPISLRFFHTVELIGTIASLRLAGTQVLPFFYVPISKIPAVELVLRFYIALFCLGICVVELHLPIQYIQSNPILQNYLSRGLLYSFLALAAMNEAFSVQVQDMVQHTKSLQHIPWIAIFTEMSSWPVFIIGHIYMMLGIFCLKPYRDRLTADYQELMEDYRRELREQQYEGMEEPLVQKARRWLEKLMP